MSAAQRCDTVAASADKDTAPSCSIKPMKLAAHVRRAKARGSISRSISPTSKPAGLLVRIDRPINKDTELHPLVRWQFVGGVPEDKRRAFLFTNVIDAKGRHYDIPVVVGALAASPEIYAHRHGPAGRGDRRSLDARRSRIRSRRSRSTSPPCQEVVHHRRRPERAGRRADAPAGAGLDAGLRLRALSDRDAVHHPRSRHRHPEHGHLSRRAEGDRPAGRAHGGARGERRRRLSALAQISRAQASRCRSPS